VPAQVALGRCSLDPLPVLASLCGPSAEVLAMRLHPLQHLLPRGELLAAAERVCITAVNQARGVPLHIRKPLGPLHDGLACSLMWEQHAPPLQPAFIHASGAERSATVRPSQEKALKSRGKPFGRRPKQGCAA
jgi:hypothetical protein